MAAAATIRHVDNSAAATIVDAGCGTGKVGIALRHAGWIGKIVGLDLSQGMLDQASTFDVYDELLKCSLLDVPLAELGRITTAGGVVVVTRRLDQTDDFVRHVDGLHHTRVWDEVERTEPEQLHPDRDDSEQIVITWRVRSRP